VQNPSTNFARGGELCPPKARLLKASDEAEKTTVKAAIWRSCPSLGHFEGIPAYSVRLDNRRAWICACGENGGGVFTPEVSRGRKSGEAWTTSS
jgi:hypothetical protein